MAKAGGESSRREWHPLFAELLRPLLEGHYEVETNMPVGDKPREADLVLLRRTSTEEPPFQGLWRWLTLWNVLEFKGPREPARVAELDRLSELGLGIDRRLREERPKRKEPIVARHEVTLWYLVNHLGKRFLREARELLGGLEEVDSGVWRSRLLGRQVLLVSNREVPVQRDSIPVHLLVKEPLEATRRVAEEVASQKDLWEMYSGWVATLFPVLWDEVKLMGRSKSGPVLDLRPVIEQVGLKTVIDQVGIDRVVDEIGWRPVLDRLGMDAMLAQMTAEERRELLQRLQEDPSS
jgi:hypothetical protein